MGQEQVWSPQEQEHNQEKLWTSQQQQQRSQEQVWSSPQTQPVSEPVYEPVSDPDDLTTLETSNWRGSRTNEFHTGNAINSAQTFIIRRSAYLSCLGLGYPQSACRSVGEKNAT